MQDMATDTGALGDGQTVAATAHDHIDELASWLVGPEPTGWRPIETAPGNEEVLIYVPASDRYSALGLAHKRRDPESEITTGIKLNGYWAYSIAGREYTRDDYFGDSFEPSHWMPLPPTPAQNEPSPC